MADPVLNKRFLQLKIREVPQWIGGNFTSKQRITSTLFKPFNSYQKRLAFTPLGPMFPLFIGLSFVGAYMNYDFNEGMLLVFFLHLEKDGVCKMFDDCLTFIHSRRWSLTRREIYGTTQS